MSNWNLKPGDKVVCIDGIPSPDLRGMPNYVTEGGIYTIRRIGSYPNFLVVYLEEIINPIVQTTVGMVERGFLINRFRPVRMTSIDCFKVHLLKQKENQNA